MIARPSFQLSRLREIGWTKWDPIGVGELDDGWPADEYDSYLMQAAEHIWNGKTDQVVADYLVTIETERMGLANVPGIHARAIDVAKAVRDYVETLRT